MKLSETLCSLTKVIVYNKDVLTNGSSHFTGRVGFINPMPSGDVSLYIDNTQESDSGRYHCQVIIPQGSILTADLSLDVKGKIQTLLNYLVCCVMCNKINIWWSSCLPSVPPAVPKCSLSGKPVLKGNVTLSCKSSSGKPLPIYKWKKTSPTSEVFFSPMLSE